jgi:AraC family transcriptional regulator
VTQTGSQTLARMEGAVDALALKAVERAIEMMQSNLGDRLTIDDLARSALFSKFHFSRVFQRATGTSPGRFLSALRLAEAKRLLLCTKATVADIGHQVGYNSIGTFSSRFSASVGVSPIMYRRLGGTVSQIPEHHKYRGASGTTLHGQVHSPHTKRSEQVFLGLFPSRVCEGAPIRCTVLSGPGTYQLPEVPSGVWYLTAHAVDPETGLSYVDCHGPFTAAPANPAQPVDLRLRPVSTLDPPLLLALPGGCRAG